MSEAGLVTAARRLRRGPLRWISPVWAALRVLYHEVRSVRRALVTAWRQATYRALPGPPEQVHLSWQGDPSTSFTVSWRTPGGGGRGHVEYRQAGAGDWIAVQARSRPAEGVGGSWHCATVTGLQPARAYEYRVSADPGAEPGTSATWQVRTAPPPGPADFSAAFLCDTGLVGRPDGNCTATEQVIEEIRRDDPLLVLGGGDYAYANRDTRFTARGEAVDAWFRQMQPLLVRVPLMAQYGNHEVLLEERYEDWAPRFAHPEGYQDGRCYSFAIGEVHFAAFFAPYPNLEPALFAWLDADLAAARARGARWLIVFQHLPIYSHGHSHPANPHLRATLAPILAKHRVDLHLSGHDQNYERTYPLTGSPDRPVVANRALDRYAAGEGVIYAKVSPGGKLSDVRGDFSRFTTPQQDFIAVRDDAAHHYALLHARARGELAVEVFSLARDGARKRLLDQFRIVARP